jgi:hypothetical protein
MGAWGYGALDDDAALDVYETFIEEFKQGASPEELREAFVSEWREGGLPNGQEVPFWLGLAKALWECGALSEEDLANLRELIRSEVAVEGLADEGDRRRRRAALDRFVKKISIPKAKPRRPPKRPARWMRPMFAPGTCLAIRLGEDLYGAAIAMQSSQDGPRTIWYRIVLLRCLFDRPPPIDYFESRDWLIFPKRPHAIWCDEKGLKSSAALWSVVGSMAEREDDPVVPADTFGGESFGNVKVVAQALSRRGERKS